MKNVILRSGLRSAILVTVLYFVTVLAGKWMGFAIQEFFGYAEIILSLLFVYFGIRRYRDRVNQGALSFGKGMQIGILITLMPSFLFGICDIFYTKFINPNFYKNYYAASVAQMKTTLPADKYEVALRQMESGKAMFSNPLFAFAVMFFTVFLIGVIITVISSLILRRTPKQAIIS